MTRRITRRQWMKAAAASTAAVSLATPLFAQGQTPIVIIGGGFGGTSCARALRKADPKLKITLVETNPVYTALPHSNSVIAGLSDLKAQQFNYDAIKSDGVDVVIAEAKAIDPAKKSVSLSNGATLNYERLVVSPGIAFQPNAIAGCDEAAMAAMPPAYKNGDELLVLRKQIEAMKDGGVVVISSPVNPARCPPAPYERASLIAHVLKEKKPRSKVIILDAKESFTMQKLFEASWQQLYPGLIEWVGLSQGGALIEVDAKTKTLSTDFDKYEAAVASIIPPQIAGRIADIAGVADRTGWCPVDPVTFESRLQKNIHVIGDAAIAGAMPRSASAAQGQAQICANAIVALLAGNKPAVPALSSSCYSLIAPDYAISLKGRYRMADDQYVEAEGSPVTSPQNGDAAVRRREANEAEDWYRTITGQVFG